MREFIPKSWLFIRKGYSFATFKQDLIAGITVGLVAVPLAMAFAIASGVNPEKGLYTAIVAGFLISLLGGSRFQIGGPTGAFVVILYSIIQKDGYAGLVSASLLSGVILLIAAFFRLGSLIKYIPYPLVVGFTSAIAVIIFSSQVKDFLGLHIAVQPADFLGKWKMIFASLSTWDPKTFLVGAGTLVFIIGSRKFFPKLPWGALSIVLATGVCSIFRLPVETIEQRFGVIRSGFPVFAFPDFSFTHWDSLLASAVTIAFLAGIESLLSAMVADGMTGTRHKSNCELMAQGFANIASVFFGGIPATGAIARTATNVKTGGKTPLAGMIHSITLLCVLLFLSNFVSQIPLASMAAILMVVAWNMSEIDHFRDLFRAPLGDVAILLTAFFLTIFVDLTVAVGVGIIMAAFLFMKKVGDLSQVVSFTVEEKEGKEKERPLLEGIEVYDVLGPFFFAIAGSLRSVLSNLEKPPKVFILRLDQVPVIDASGMQALKDFYRACSRDGTRLALCGVKKSVMASLKKFGVVEEIGRECFFSSFDEALREANCLLKQDG